MDSDTNPGVSMSPTTIRFESETHDLCDRRSLPILSMDAIRCIGRESVSREGISCSECDVSAGLKTAETQSISSAVAVGVASCRSSECDCSDMSAFAEAPSVCKAPDDNDLVMKVMDSFMLVLYSI